MMLVVHSDMVVAWAYSSNKAATTSKERVVVGSKNILE